MNPFVHEPFPLFTLDLNKPGPISGKVTKRGNPELGFFSNDCRYCDSPISSNPTSVGDMRQLE